MDACAKCGKLHVRNGRPTCTGHGSGISRPDRKGEPCGAFPMHGQHVCGKHGGRAQQSKAAGERQQQEDAGRRMCAKWSIPIETDPTGAILGRIAAYAGHVEFYKRQIEQLDEQDLVWGVTKIKTGGDDRGTTMEAAPNTWLTLYNEASALLVKFAADAIRAGIEERKVRLAERDGQLVAGVLRAMADSVLEALMTAGLSLDLANVYRASVAEAGPRHLRLLDGGAA